MDISKKRKGDFFNDQLLFKTVGVVFLVIIFFFVIADIKMYQRKRELTFKLEEYKKQIKEIQESNQILKEGIANSDSKDYLEKIAYEQMNQQKPGETEYIFVKAQKKTEETSQSNGLWSEKFWFGWIGQSWNWITNQISGK